MNNLTVSSIRRVIIELKKNENYDTEVIRKAIAVVNEYNIDIHTISYEGYDDSTVITAIEYNNPESLITLRYRADSRVAYVLAGLGGAY